MKNSKEKLNRLKEAIGKKITQGHMPLAYSYLAEAQTIKAKFVLCNSKFHNSSSYQVSYFYKPISLIKLKSNE